MKLECEKNILISQNGTFFYIVQLKRMTFNKSVKIIKIKVTGRKRKIFCNCSTLIEFTVCQTTIEFSQSSKSNLVIKESLKDIDDRVLFA
jgi:hypothetical protein